MLTTKNIFKLYDKYQVKASKKYGQNFLIDHFALNKIIEASEAKDSDVIEIGPGLGSLTLPLLEVASSVTSYEIDKDMIKVLKGEIKSNKFKLIEENFLDVKLNLNKNYKVIANIPYNITSDILFKLFRNSFQLESATIMVQKEVGERLLAQIDSKTYGKLSITTQLFANVEKIMIVKPSSFVPAPKIESMVIKLEFNNLNFKENEELVNFIKQIFTYRRKTLFNNLKLIIDSEQAKEIILKLNLKESCRSQELSLNQIKKMFEIIKSS